MSDRKKLIGKLAHASEKALDDAYGYGMSKPGSFGNACNLKSAERVLKLLEKGEDDIEVLADESHEGWADIAKTFDDPIYKERPEKKAKRLELANTSYKDLAEDEKEKDRVAARALLKTYKKEKG